MCNVFLSSIPKDDPMLNKPEVVQLQSTLKNKQIVIFPEATLREIFIRSRVVVIARFSAQIIILSQFLIVIMFSNPDVQLSYV